MKNIPILNVYYLLCYAWGRVQERDTARLATLGGLSTVQDLLGKVLAGGVNHLFRRGIDRGYVERREDLAGIRGKLAVSETAKRALRARARAACDFEELSGGHPPEPHPALVAARAARDGASRSTAVSAPTCAPPTEGSTASRAPA